MKACVSWGAQLSFTEKGVRKLMESVKSYRAALNDTEVLQTFQVLPSPPSTSL